MDPKFVSMNEWNLNRAMRSFEIHTIGASSKSSNPGDLDLKLSPLTMI